MFKRQGAICTLPLFLIVLAAVTSNVLLIIKILPAYAGVL